MTTTLTKTDIILALRRFGLTTGDVLEVHSSLRSMGQVEGGAETVIQALMEVVGSQGAIVMPAHRVSLPVPPTAEEAALGMRSRVRMYTEGNVPQRSGMGLVADTFRARTDVVLGSGLHRVCAWGEDAETHAEEGFQHLLDLDGWTLLIGVDIHRCTSMHAAEKDVFPQAVKDYQQTPPELLARYDPDVWWIEFEDPGKPPLADVWGKVFAEADRRGLVQRGKIGDADCLFFKARPMAAIYHDWLVADGAGLFGVE